MLLLTGPSQISEAVLASGENLSRSFRIQEQSPLMYSWYQEQYVGAAHGLAGIYYYLMQVTQDASLALRGVHLVSPQGSPPR